MKSRFIASRQNAALDWRKTNPTPIEDLSWRLSVRFGSNLLTQKNIWMKCVKRFRIDLNAQRLNEVAFAREPSRQTNPVKGLDLDDPEARQRFIQGEL